VKRLDRAKKNSTACSSQPANKDPPGEIDGNENR
jgi:hypothetical protein